MQAPSSKKRHFSRLRKHALLAVSWIAIGPLDDTTGQTSRLASPLARFESGPGQGPQVEFDEGMWQFWWHLNEEAVLGFRKRMGVPKVSDSERMRGIEALRSAVKESGGKSPELLGMALMALGKAQSNDPPQEDVAILVGALGNPSVEIQSTALLALGVMGGKDASAALIDAVSGRVKFRKQGDPLRGIAAIALGLSESDEAKTAFLRWLDPRILNEFGTATRRGVAIGAGLLNDRDVSEAAWNIVKAQKLSDRFARGSLIQAAARFQDGDWLSEMESILRDDDVHARRGAVLGFGQSGIGRDDAEKVLWLRRKEPDQLTRYFRGFAIAWYQGAGPRSTASSLLRSSPRDGIQGSIRQADECFAALAAGMAGAIDSIEEMASRFRSSPQSPSELSALSLSMGLVHDRNPLDDSLRSRVIAVINKELNETWNPETRSYMALGLGLLGSKQHEKDLLGFLLEQEEVELIVRSSMGLSLMGSRKAAIDAIVRRLSLENDEYVLQSLAFSLGRIGDETAVDALIAVLNGHRPGGKKRLRAGSRIDYVRGYAAIALGYVLDPKDTPSISRLTTHFNYVSETQYWDFLLRQL